MKVFSNIIHLYTDGFKNMTWGKTLWIIILVKLLIMFAILKIFFFPDLLKSNFNTDKERSEEVSKELINR
ncbi:MAG: DUF4492 domain-containing protein [Candidatus Azobacteroides sp.]|nr:DUF4492 domain-containing protein [Candidatus Azobacteroides sp.]